MVIPNYEFMYECTVVKERHGPHNTIIEEHYEDFSDIQMAYYWIKDDLGFEIPSDRNFSEIDGFECMSFRFTIDTLNMNTRREGFNFGVVPVMSDDLSYVIYYKRPNRNGNNNNNGNNGNNGNNNNGNNGNENNNIIR